jgi:uncharacterized membrane protein
MSLSAAGLPQWLFPLVAEVVGTDLLFALLVLRIALDRDVKVGSATATSVRTVAANPGTMATWA